MKTLKAIATLIALGFITSAHAQTIPGIQNLDFDIKNVPSESEILIATPAEVEALSQDSEIISPNDYRELVRVEAQAFNSPQRGGGYAVWMMYRNRISKKWELAARFDTIHRYGITDRSIGGGALLHMNKSVLRFEMAKSGRGGLLPDTTYELEYVTPLTKTLVGYIGARRTEYSADGATNLLTYLAAEYYIAGNNMIFARISRSHSTYSTGASNTQPTAVVHFTHYINDFDKVSVFVGNASESVLRNYDNVVNTARGITYGASYRHRLGAQSPWLIEIGIEQSHVKYPSRKVTDRAVRLSLTRLIK